QSTEDNAGITHVHFAGALPGRPAIVSDHIDPYVAFIPVSDQKVYKIEDGAIADSYELRDGLAPVSAAVAPLHPLLKAQGAAGFGLGAPPNDPARAVQQVRAQNMNTGTGGGPTTICTVTITPTSSSSILAVQ